MPAAKVGLRKGQGQTGKKGGQKISEKERKRKGERQTPMKRQTYRQIEKCTKVRVGKERKLK